MNFYFLLFSVSFWVHFREICAVFISSYRGCVSPRDSQVDSSEFDKIRLKRGKAKQKPLKVPRAREQDDGILPHKLPQTIAGHGRLGWP